MAVGTLYLVSPDAIVGFVVTWDGTQSSLADGMGSVGSNLFQEAGVHGKHNIGNAYITGTLAYGWQSIDTESTVHFTKRISSMTTIVPLHGRGDLSLDKNVAFTARGALLRPAISTMIEMFSL